ncbi:hypothetical protein SAMD00019534_069100, partial [Acytostelium subglobosum LB1]|uniref:hypothetical protein n=1 Tax=Acytostelium subglobosum LB1 TaxID=1410327 RepID=UPI000644CAA8
MSTDHQDYNWRAWNADWKVWWGDKLGMDGLKQSGLEDKKKHIESVKAKPRMEKSASFEDAAKFGVNGATHNTGKAPMISNPYFPEAKRPTYERNKYDDELLKKQQLQDKVGSGNA